MTRYNLLDEDRNKLLQNASSRDIAEYLHINSRCIGLSTYANSGYRFRGKYYVEYYGLDEKPNLNLPDETLGEWELARKPFLHCIWVKPGTPQARGAIKLSVAKR